MALVLDAGGLIAVDRLDRKVGAILRVAQQENLRVRTSATVVAQVWRSGSRQANLARVLTGIDVAALDMQTDRSVGEVLALSRTTDVGRWSPRLHCVIGRHRAHERHQRHQEDPQCARSECDPAASVMINKSPSSVRDWPAWPCLPGLPSSYEWLAFRSASSQGVFQVPRVLASTGCGSPT